MSKLDNEVKKRLKFFDDPKNYKKCSKCPIKRFTLPEEGNPECADNKALCRVRR